MMNISSSELRGFSGSLKLAHPRHCHTGASQTIKDSLEIEFYSYGMSSIAVLLSQQTGALIVYSVCEHVCEGKITNTQQKMG